jgi:hypothetical protein
LRGEDRHPRRIFGPANLAKVTHLVLDALPDRVPTAQVEHNTNQNHAPTFGAARPMRIKPVPLSWLVRTKPFALSLTRNDRQSAPMTSLRQEVVTPPIRTIVTSADADEPLLIFTRSLVEPILESQPRHFLEIPAIGRKKEGVIGHRDAGHLQIHRTDFDARFAEAVEKVNGVGIH